MRNNTSVMEINLSKCSRHSNDARETVKVRNTDISRTCGCHIRETDSKIARKKAKALAKAVGRSVTPESETSHHAVHLALKQS
jgi:hypothetical protein